MACSSASYYSGVSWDGLVGSTLRQALHTHISAGHTVIPYTSSSTTDCWDALSLLDKDPAVNGNVIELYTQKSVSASANVDSTGWNREHVWPKSFGVGYSGADTSDVHSLCAADWSVNSARGNKAFGECNPAHDSTCTSPAHAEAANDTAANPSLFMPPATVRGNIARSLFYMATRYDGVDANTEALELSSCPEASVNAMGNLTTLLKWHAEDPPDAHEVWRTEKACSLYQGNRNPYIDFPELVGRVWSASYHDDFVCRTDLFIGVNSTFGPSPQPSFSPAGPCMILTGLIDGTLPGGMPKAVEITLTCDVSPMALSQYGLGSANNGGGTDGEEFAFPTPGEIGSRALPRGSSFTVAYESTNFAGSFVSFFGHPPNFTDSSLNVNGDDAIELFWRGNLLDVFGIPDVGDEAQSWQYSDGVAYRKAGTSASTVWRASDWIVKAGVLSGYGTNALAMADNVGLPLGSYELSPTPAPTLLPASAPTLQSSLGLMTPTPTPTMLPVSPQATATTTSLQTGNTGFFVIQIIGAALIVLFMIGGCYFFSRRRWGDTPLLKLHPRLKRGQSAEVSLQNIYEHTDGDTTGSEHPRRSNTHVGIL